MTTGTHNKDIVPISPNYFREICIFCGLVISLLISCRTFLFNDGYGYNIVESNYPWCRDQVVTLFNEGYNIVESNYPWCRDQVVTLFNEGYNIVESNYSWCRDQVVTLFNEGYNIVESNYPWCRDQVFTLGVKIINVNIYSVCYVFLSEYFVSTHLKNSYFIQKFKLIRILLILEDFLEVYIAYQIVYIAYQIVTQIITFVLGIWK